MTAPARISQADIERAVKAARPVKLPSSTEIKRVIAAVRKAGVEVGAVDIRADGITLHPPAQREANAYDEWKQSESRPTRR